MIPRINGTGIRDGEYIIGTGPQVKGTIMQIKGQYPPLKGSVEDIPTTQLRDGFNTIPFFKTMTVEERKQWLTDHYVTNNDLYLTSCPTFDSP